MFEAVLGSAKKGHLALDDIDIVISKENCDLTPIEADPTGMITLCV